MGGGQQQQQQSAGAAPYPAYSGLQPYGSPYGGAQQTSIPSFQLIGQGQDQLQTANEKDQFEMLMLDLEQRMKARMAADMPEQGYDSGYSQTADNNQFQF